MKETALNVLKKLESNGYEAYIVGGFVRDYILNRKSVDVDINTNATPQQIKNIFPKSFVPKEAYGSITIIENKVRMEITTFRVEYKYYNNRKPVEIEYTNSLIDDLKRRDFTINALCMDSNGNIIDPLNVMGDVKNRTIKTIGNSESKFTEDALRILRAIRFATVLEFKIDDEVKESIQKTKKYLSNISYNRKKEELDKIFMNKNSKYGVDLLLDLGLDKELEIYNLKDIKLSNDLLGIWSSLQVSENYPFTKNEKELIKRIKIVEKENNLDNYILYKYGPYVNSVAAVNKGIKHTDIINAYNSLPIKARSDILISSSEIMSLLNRQPGKYINVIYNDLELAILNGYLKNTNESIKQYIINKYRTTRIG